MNPETVLQIARLATAHNSGETVMSWHIDPRWKDTVILVMSSWPRAREAAIALEKRGYQVVQDQNALTVADPLIEIGFLPPDRQPETIDTWLDT